MVNPIGPSSQPQPPSSSGTTPAQQAGQITDYINDYEAYLAEANNFGVIDNTQYQQLLNQLHAINPNSLSQATQALNACIHEGQSFGLPKDFPSFTLDDPYCFIGAFKAYGNMYYNQTDDPFGKMNFEEETLLFIPFQDSDQQIIQLFNSLGSYFPSFPLPDPNNFSTQVPPPNF